jgi:hypothetical protein
MRGFHPSKCFLYWFGFIFSSSEFRRLIWSMNFRVSNFCCFIYIVCVCTCLLTWSWRERGSVMNFCGCWMIGFPICSWKPNAHNYWSSTDLRLLSAECLSSLARLMVNPWFAVLGGWYPVASELLLLQCTNFVKTLLLQICKLSWWFRWSDFRPVDQLCMWEALLDLR